MNPKTIIRLLRPVAVRGVVTPPLGEPFEAPTGEAHVVLAMEAAERVSDEDFKKYQAEKADEAAKAKAKEVSSPGTIQQADPVAEHRDPQIAPKASSGKRR